MPPKRDHPGYSYERTHWVLFTGVGPLNLWAETRGSKAAASLLRQRMVDKLAEIRRFCEVVNMKTQAVEYPVLWLP